METTKDKMSRVEQILERVTKLNAPERGVLKGLRSHRTRPTSNTELAADLLILPSTVEKCAQRLEEEGFVVIEQGLPEGMIKSDRGATDYIQKIKLTESGEDALSLLPLVEKET